MAGCTKNSDNVEFRTNEANNKIEVYVEERTLNNEGLNGVHRNADGHKGENVWGQRSPWVALTAEKEDEVVTITIFDLQDNPFYPAWSHARGYGLFAVFEHGAPAE